MMSEKDPCWHYTLLDLRSGEINSDSIDRNGGMCFKGDKSSLLYITMSNTDCGVVYNIP